MVLRPEDGKSVSPLTFSLGARDVYLPSRYDSLLRLQAKAYVYLGRRPSVKVEGRKIHQN